MKSTVQFLSSMIIFGTIGLFVRYIDLPSSGIALLRGVIGSLFLLAIFLATKRKITWGRIRENIVVLLFSGAALGLNWIFLFEAYKRTTISNAALSYYFAPVFVMLLSPLIRKERLTAMRLTCAGIAVLGMFFIMGSGGSAAGPENLLGIGCGLAAALGYASLMLLNKFLKNLTGLETTLIQLSAASLLLLPYVLLTEPFSLGTFTGRTIVLIFVLGILHTGVGFFLFFSGMKGLSGQSVAVMSYLDPVTSVAISAFLLREGMTALQAIGGVLLLGSIFVSEKARFRIKS
jgi:drug/metabolite transporter (DMT)-like permease